MDINKIVHFLIIELPVAISILLMVFHFWKKNRERIAEEQARAAAESEKENRARAAEEKRKAAEQARERAAAERREKEENRHAEKRRRAEELAELAERRLNAEREYIRLKTLSAKNTDPVYVMEAESVQTPEPVTEPIQIIPFNELIKECSQQPLSDQGSAVKLPEMTHRESAKNVISADKRAYKGFGFNCPVLDARRVTRAREEVEIISLYSDPEDYHAICKGSEGNEYNTTLSSCECRDFFVHRQPCKHMIRLAMIAGLLNDKGETPEQEITRMKTDAQIKAALSRGFMEMYGVELMPADVLSEISFFNGSAGSVSQEAAAVLDIPLNDFINKAKQLI